MMSQNTSETALETQSSKDLERLAHALDNDADHVDSNSTQPASTGKSEKFDPFEVTLGPEDDPKNLPSWRKWLVIFVISAGTLCATSASSMVCLNRGFVAIVC